MNARAHPTRVVVGPHMSLLAMHVLLCHVVACTFFSSAFFLAQQGCSLI